MLPYIDFLKSKIELHEPTGFSIDRDSLPNTLLDHAKDTVVWGLGKGRAGIFSSFGMTKTRTNIAMLLEVRKIRPYSPVLVICPLGVKSQFQGEDGPVMGVEFEYITCRQDQHNASSDFHITNYDRIADGDFDFSLYSVVALDEGAKLRSISSNTTQALLRKFKSTEFKFVFTAVPSPNDYTELLNYAEFLGIMDRSQAKTRFCLRDSEHADEMTIDPEYELEFWMWVHSWALFLEKPSDLGYSDEGYEMPEIVINWHEVAADQDKIGEFKNRDGQFKIMADSSSSLVEESKIKKATVNERVAKAMEIIAESPNDNFLIWHLRDDEKDAIEKALPGVVTVHGKLSIDEKERRVHEFSHGKIKYLAPKPEICGSGCNFQYHCHRAIYASIDHRFHDFIQSIYRIARFSQMKRCIFDIIYSSAEVNIATDLRAKWEADKELRKRMRAILKEFGLSQIENIKRLTRSFGLDRVEVKGKMYTAINNDSVLEIKNNVPSNSWGMIMSSIPFSIQYEYAQSYNDFGHNLTNERFFEQMHYIIPEKHRALMPGRLCVLHVKDRIEFGNYTGKGFPTVYEFSDDTIKAYKAHGFAYCGRITIVTDVVRENNQTYRLGWSEVCKDGTKMGAGLPEYLLLFRKLPTDTSNGYADVPVLKSKKDYTRARWQIDAHGHWRSSGDRLLTPAEIAQMDIKRAMAYFNNLTYHEIYNYENHVSIAEEMEKAKKLPTSFMAVAPQSPHPDVWTDITRMRTLNTLQGQRKEELHLCPLPFDIVERAINRYSNKGDTVADPFAGVFTVPLVADKMDRYGWGCELNPAYHTIGNGYLRDHELSLSAPTLFDLLNVA